MDVNHNHSRILACQSTRNIYKMSDHTGIQAGRGAAKNPCWGCEAMEYLRKV